MTREENRMAMRILEWFRPGGGDDDEQDDSGPPEQRLRLWCPIKRRTDRIWFRDGQHVDVTHDIYQGNAKDSGDNLIHAPVSAPRGIVQKHDASPPDIPVLMRRVGSWDWSEIPTVETIEERDLVVVTSVLRKGRRFTYDGPIHVVPEEEFEPRALDLKTKVDRANRRYKQQALY